MVVLAVSIDEKGRQLLSTILLFAHLSVAVISFIIIIIGLTLAVLFYQQRDVLKTFGYNKLTFLIIISGLLLCALHLFSAKLSFDCSHLETRQRFTKFTPIILKLLLVAPFLLVVVSISASASIYKLTKGYEKGFLKLMEAYDEDKTKRMEIDILQVKNRCCGSTGYKDWIETDWYPDEFIRPELRGSKGRGVPFTCCDPEYMGPCLHDAGDNSRPGYKKAGGKQYYPDGCADRVTGTVRWLLNQLSLWLILPIFLELAVFVGVKYLFTSILGAEEEGDAEDPGFGYLMEKCPCACLAFLDGDFTSIVMFKKSKD